MKKILLIIAFLFAGITAFSQSGVPEPTHTLTPSKFKPGNWHMLGAWDSTNACYADTLGYYMEGDTVKIWSNKILWINGNTVQPNLWKLTTNKLEPVVSTNFINTDSSYYLKGVDFIRYFGDPYYSLGIGDASMTNDTVSYHNISIGRNSLNRTSTGNNIVSIGNSSLSMNKSGTGNTSIGYQSMYSNTTGSYNVSTGYSCLLSNKTGNNNTSYGYYSNRFTSSGNNNTSIGYYSLANNTTDSNNIAIGYYAGYDATLSNRLWIGQGDSTQAIIYGEMLTRPRIRINGELNVSSKLTALKATVDTLEITSDYLLYEMPHCYFYKVDTAGYTLTLDQNVWKSLGIAGMTDAESHTINRSGDTIVYQGIKDAHILIDININGTTSAQNDDIWLRVYNVTAGIITDYDFRTSSGSGNYGRWGVNSYSTTCAPGEKYLIQMKNKTNGNDMTLYRVSILFKVLHYE